jgi:hypothetical protein
MSAIVFTWLNALLLTSRQVLLDSFAGSTGSTQSEHQRSLVQSIVAYAN